MNVADLKRMIADLPDDTDVVILGTIIIGIVAFAFEMAMRWIERRALVWRPGFIAARA